MYKIAVILLSLLWTSPTFSEEPPADLSLRFDAGNNWAKEGRSGGYAAPYFGSRLTLENLRWLESSLGISASELWMGGGFEGGQKNTGLLHGSLFLNRPFGPNAELGLSAEGERNWRANLDRQTQGEAASFFTIRMPVGFVVKGLVYAEADAFPSPETTYGTEGRLGYSILSSDNHGKGITLLPTIGIGAFRSLEPEGEGTTVRYYSARLELKGLRLFDRRLRANSSINLQLPFQMRDRLSGEVIDHPYRREKVRTSVRLQYRLGQTLAGGSLFVELTGSVQWRAHPRRPVLETHDLSAQIVWSLPILSREP